MIQRSIPLLGACALMFTAQTAQAKPFHLEVGPYVGGYLFSDGQDLGEYDGETPPSDWPSDGLTFGGRLGIYFMKAAGLEGEFGMTPTSLSNSDGSATVTNYRWAGVFGLPLGDWQPFILAGYGEMKLSSDPSPDGVGDDTDPAFHWGLGVKYFLNDWLGLRLDARHLITDGVDGSLDTSNFEFTVSPFLHFGRGEAAPPPVDPDPDKDTVQGAADRCPSLAGPVENAGCPDIDTDADGVVDRLDTCPTQAGVKETNGCPDADRDGDGLVDRLDTCPDVRGTAEFQGCPPPDKDGDGLLDSLDKCPEQPETANGYQDDDGCPDEVPAAVQKFTGALRGIQFALGKADILPNSKPTLDEAVKVLQEYPELKVEISGHTDNLGPRDLNMTLSQQRAESVKAYLVGKGVVAERLTTVGFGPDKPMADNATPAGQEQNRRIEFRLLP